MSEGKSRRDFFKAGLAVVPAAALASAVPAAAKPAAYTPTYFRDDEWVFLQAAVDRLIPSDATGPGALETGVPEFLDRQMETPYGHGKLWYMEGPFVTDAKPEFGYQLRLTPREIYRLGIKSCEAATRAKHGKSFAELDAAAQDDLLKAMEAGKLEMEPLPAKTFFSFLLANCREGYLSDPIYGGNKNMGGWQMIGFPGARGNYLDWIDTPGEPHPIKPVSIAEE